MVNIRSINPKAALNPNCTTKLFFLRNTAGICEPPKKLTMAKPYRNIAICLTYVVGGTTWERFIMFSLKKLITPSMALVRKME